MKKVLFIFLALTFLIISFAGCSPAEYSPRDDYYAKGEMSDTSYENDEAGYAPPAMPEPAPAVQSEGSEFPSGPSLNYEGSLLNPSVNRKIIFEGTLSIETTNFDDDYNRIKQALSEFGGYAERDSVYGTKPVNWNEKGRTAELTLRIPSKRFDEYILRLKGLGETLSMSTSGRDVSLQYFDSETRLKTLRIRQERLLDLLENAKGLEDIIKLEQELGNVDYQIQSYEIELRSYDSLIDFSSITIQLHEVNQIERVTSSDKQDLGTRITTGFYSVLNVLAAIGEGLLIFFLAGSPVLVPLIIAGVIAIIVVKRRKKKAKGTQV